jgi:hypothetical protein
VAGPELIVRFRFTPEAPRQADPGVAALGLAAVLAGLVTTLGGFVGWLGGLGLAAVALAVAGRCLAPEARRRPISVGVTADGIRGIDRDEVLVPWAQLGAATWRDDGVELAHGPFLPLAGLVEGTVVDLERIVGPRPARRARRAAPAHLWAAPARDQP